MFETIKTDTLGRVGIISMNQSKRRNVLSNQMMEDISAAAERFDLDPEIGCLVLTAKGPNFSGGADMAELAAYDRTHVTANDVFADWDRFAGLRIPKVAAVRGYALGPGCEIAMMCDVIIAADSARFAMPGIRHGMVPGLGGSQRLVQRVGTAKAMDLLLTGRMICAGEATQMGLASRSVPDEDLDAVAKEAAATISGFAPDTAQMIKGLVQMAENAPLASGLAQERAVFNSHIGLPSQIEGVTAHLEKRPAQFTKTESRTAGRSMLAAE